MFFEFLRYVLYLKDEKAKFKIFFSGFPLEFRDLIKYDRPWSLQEVIWKLNHCDKNSKCKTKYQQG